MQLSIPSFWRRSILHLLTVLLPALTLIGCGSVPTSAPPVKDTSTEHRPVPSVAKIPDSAPALPPAGSGRGGYYQDDGPGDVIPEGLQATPDPEPKLEPYSTRGNRPYVVFGKTYTPITDDRPLKQRGVGSWYGKKFHGQKTSSGERYDMYKLTAAHPTLPIPSYARVTNLNNGTQVVVRVNDRGPFHANRIIDLSYTAALKLGYLGKGSSQLEVERILPEEIARMASKKNPLARTQETPVQAQIPKPAPMPPVEMAALPVTTPTKTSTPAVTPAPIPELHTVNLPASATTAPLPQPDLADVVASITTPPQNIGLNGIYLQLGAFGQAANAEAARSQFMQTWVMILPPVEVVQDGTLFRLYSGPFANRDDAAAAAQQLQDAGTTRPMIVQR